MHVHITNTHADACTCDATQQSHQMMEKHQQEATAVYIYTEVLLQLLL